MLDLLLFGVGALFSFILAPLKRTKVAWIQNLYRHINVDQMDCGIAVHSTDMQSNNQE